MGPSAPAFQRQPLAPSPEHGFPAGAKRWHRRPSEEQAKEKHDTSQKNSKEMTARSRVWRRGMTVFNSRWHLLLSGTGWREEPGAQEEALATLHPCLSVPGLQLEEHPWTSSARRGWRGGWAASRGRGLWQSRAPVLGAHRSPNRPEHLPAPPAFVPCHARGTRGARVIRQGGSDRVTYSAEESARCEFGVA